MRPRESQRDKVGERENKTGRKKKKEKKKAKVRQTRKGERDGESKTGSEGEGERDIDRGGKCADVYRQMDSYRNGLNSRPPTDPRSFIQELAGPFPFSLFSTSPRFIPAFPRPRLRFVPFRAGFVLSKGHPRVFYTLSVYIFS